MPIFEYRCSVCGHCFERITRAPAEDHPCPACAAPARRMVSAPTVAASPAPGGAGGGCAPRGGFS